MNVVVRSEPRIVVKIVAEIDGEKLDMIELIAMLEALELGDTAIDNEELALALQRLNAIDSYAVEGGRSIATAGARFSELLEAVRTAAAASDLELPTSRD